MKQLVKSSAVARFVLSLPLWAREKFLYSKYQPAYKALGRLGECAQHDIAIFVPEFDATFSFSAKSYLFQRCVIFGSYEPAVSRMFFEHVDPAKDVVDVGANIGFYTVGAARRLKTGRVLAVEPTASAFNRLAKNVESNGVEDRVILVKSLLADALGEGNLNVAVGHEEFSSLGKMVHPTLLNETYRTETVPIQTLDALAELHGLSPGLIKIDVEGAELKVLKGAIATIRRCRPFIVTECSDMLLGEQGATSVEMCDYLRTLGYQIINPEAPGISLGKKVSGDIFCIPIR